MLITVKRNDSVTNENKIWVPGMKKKELKKLNDSQEVFWQAYEENAQFLSCNGLCKYLDMMYQ